MPGPRKKQHAIKSRPSAPSANRGIRLQKIMAAVGIGSRRACEALIEEGRVAVNGKTVRRMPALVDPRADAITVDGEPLARYMPKALRQTHGAGDKRDLTNLRAYVMLYKPRATITAASDPEGRRTVTDIVQHPSGIRLYPVGRLDFDDMGLVLLTNDGDLTHKLTHPRFGVHKTYRALVKGELNENSLARLKEAMRLANIDPDRARTIGAPRHGRDQDIEIDIFRAEQTRTIIDITFKGGRDPQIKKLLLRAGSPVRKLVRIAMGPISLSGLKLGQWRDLTRDEVRALKRAADDKGPKGLDPRTRLRSHAMQTGASRAPRIEIDDEEMLGVASRSEAPSKTAPPPGRGRSMRGEERGRDTGSARPSRTPRADRFPKTTAPTRRERSPRSEAPSKTTPSFERGRSSRGDERGRDTPRADIKAKNRPAPARSAERRKDTPPARAARPAPAAKTSRFPLDQPPRRLKT